PISSSASAARERMRHWRSAPRLAARGLACSHAGPPGPSCNPLHQSLMRLTALAFLFVAAPLAAQQPRQLTAEDYARAERFLAPATMPLVSGTSVQPTWLDDGRFWYRATTGDGSAFMLVDPARGTRTALFDHPRLATALATAGSGRVLPTDLPFRTLELARDGRSI